jgi:hypothetical protein
MYSGHFFKKRFKLEIRNFSDDVGFLVGACLRQLLKKYFEKSSCRH